MHYIVLDLEATCWKEKRNDFQNEIIEIGALKINEQQTIVESFSAFIKPTLNPELSSFCTTLTTIKQNDIDCAETFPIVLDQFLQWIDLASPYVLCSWGFYDKSQFKKDCHLHNLEIDWLKNHISLKHQYAKIKGLKRPIGMGQALKKEKLILDGVHHRGIDDAKNISKIFLNHFRAWEI